MSTDTSLFESLKRRANEFTLKSRALDVAPIGITIADISEPDEPLIYVNDGFVEMTGYPEAESVGRNCRFLQGEATEEEPVARMREAIANRESTSVELRNYRKDGTMFWNQVTLAPIPDDREITYYVGFQQDITRRKEFEHELTEQRDTLETLNAMVRHDIRNDLQLTLSSLELLEPHVETSGKEHLATALESTEQAIQLTLSAREIADVLLREGAETHPVALEATLVDEIESVRAEYADVTVTVEGTTPRVGVQADKMLPSLFRNLLTNAVKHNDSDEPTIRITVATDADTVEVRIADNGPGIPAEQQKTIFEKGNKGDGSDGTGIGLYLVKRLAESYGGSVELVDGDREGATFVVTLPLA